MQICGKRELNHGSAGTNCMPLVRKPFVEFLAELAVAVEAGREDEPIAEVVQYRIVEVAPGDWRLSMVLDHAVEVIGDESFSTHEEAVETTIERMEDCMDADQVRIGRIQ
jgi:hypothetical protein